MGPGARMTGFRIAQFYAAYFSVSAIGMPFWPVWLVGQGLQPHQIGLGFAASQVGRLFGMLIVSEMADRLGHRKRLIVILTCLWFSVHFLFFVAGDAGTIILGMALAGLAISGVTPLTENLATLAVSQRGLDYGRMRMWGSISFVLVSWASGVALAGREHGVILWAVVAATSLTVLSSFALPDLRPAHHNPTTAKGGFAVLLRNKSFLCLLAGASLVQTSHAMLYGFGTLHWKESGIGEDVIGALWAEATILETLLLAAAGRYLRTFSPWQFLAIGAVAGAIRWSFTAFTVEPGMLALLQPLHALSFCATHLGTMQWLAANVPPHRMARAQSLYTCTAHGVIMALGLWGSGQLYASLGGQAFLPMAVLAFLGLVPILALARLGRIERPEI
jgi:MFS transporter, PPP family, 3-phenylpropionic acid transporter